MVADGCNPSIRKKQEDCQEFEASLGYRPMDNNKIFLCVLVQGCSFSVQVHVPACAQVCGGPRSALEVAPQASGPLLFETGSLTKAWACWSF